MFVSTPTDWMPGWSCRSASAGSRRRCRPVPGTSTRTCCRARTAGRSSTPGSGCRTRRRSGGESLGGRRGGADLRHPLPPRPRRRGRRRRRADAGAGHQGALDYAQCELVWGNPNWPERIADWFRTHGVPDEITEELIGSGDVYRPFIRFQRDPILVDDGDRLDGWELVAAPGHADGQLCLLKERRARLGRPPARPDLADRRPLAGEPARSARRLPRVARADDRARARDRAPGPRRPDRRSGRPRARADRAPPRAARVRRGRARPMRRGPATRSRSTSSAPS